jgi:hypothetical protein
MKFYFSPVAAGSRQRSTATVAEGAAANCGGLYKCCVRRIVLLTVAGVASAVCSALGIASWRAMGAGASAGVLLQLFCIFPALSFVAFCVYFLRPRLALAAAFLLLTGSFVTAYFLHLAPCLTHTCSTADSLHMGWQALSHTRPLWPLAAFALCLLMDYTRAEPRTQAVVQASADHDLRT